MEFLCVDEEKIGDKWLAHWEQVWPSCKNWYLSEGLLRRPGYQSCLSALEEHMPEIVPIYNQLTDKVGGDDIESRFLSLYSPPPYLAGCSQAVWDRDELFLIKNYDYGLSVFERTLFRSNWVRPVIGLLDCAWGLLDGINGSGLIASLTFGGKKKVGEGFGAPLILRYLLESCDTVAQAKVKIKNIPCHMSYNINLLDATGAYTKVFLAPDKPAVFQRDKVSTNHQEEIDWLEYATFSRTLERYELLKNKLSDPTMTKESLVSSFFKKPFYNKDFDRHFGTIYTSKYYPKELKMSFLWWNQSIEQSFDHFTESKTYIEFKEEEEF